MRFNATFASAAALHSDGTYSVLNAGISRFSSPTEPSVRANGVLVIFITPHHAQGEIGTHDLVIKVVGPDKTPIHQKISKFKFSGSSSVLILGFDFTFRKAGKYEIWLEMGNQLQDVYPIEVALKKPGDPGKETA